MIDEIEVLQRFRANVPPADDQSLLRARAALVHHATDSRAAPSHSRRVFGRRLALGAGLVVIAVIATAGVPSGPGPMPASAAELLDKAATAAAATPDPPTHPGQFTYFETLITFPGTPARHEQKWVPVDGNGPALDRIWWDYLGPAPGRQPSERRAHCDVHSDARPPFRDPLCPGTSLSFTPTYDYLRSLPTDTEELRKISYSLVDPGLPKPAADFWAYGMVTGLSQCCEIPPALRAALYRLAATSPDVTLVDDVVDGLGRHGIGVSRGMLPGSEDRGTLIFDKKTYKLLGREVITYHGKPLTTTILRSGIVDQIGQVP